MSTSIEPIQRAHQAGVLLPSDVVDPFLKDLPPEWQGIPPELKAHLMPRRGILLKEEWEHLERVMRSEWLLLVNYWHFRCKRCNQIHTYYTKGCIEKPFNRLNAIVGLIKDKEAELNGDLVLDGISLGTVVPIREADATRLRYKIMFRTREIA